MKLSPTNNYPKVSNEKKLEKEASGNYESNKSEKILKMIREYEASDEEKLILEFSKEKTLNEIERKFNFSKTNKKYKMI